MFHYFTFAGKNLEHSDKSPIFAPMKKTNILQYSLSIVLGIAAFLFWWMGHPELISFHEQNQLFLLTGDYFLERMSVPSGLADYLGEALVQFFYFIGIGSAIIGALLALMQILLNKALRHQTPGYRWLPWVISIVTTLVMWALLMDENTMLTYPVAICLTLTSYLLCRRWGWMAHLVASVAMYWLVGPAFVIQSGLAIIDVCLSHKWQKAIVPSLLLAATAIAWVYVCRTFWVAQYPWDTVLAGINYHRLTRMTCSAPDNQYGLIGLLFVLTVFALLFTRIRTKREGGTFIELCTILCLLICSAYPLHEAFTTDNPHDINTHAILEQAYLVRKGDWQGVISKAEEYNSQHIEALKTPLSANAVNLALAKTHQLASRMFEFPQSGIQGLLMPNVRDNVSNVITMEAFWELGFINESLRYAFDSQESIANCRKSGRFMRRMVECNIINGQYDLASKYIDLLKQSLFYRDWAQIAETYLYNEIKINIYPEWQQRREMRLESDFLFYYPEMPKMLGNLVMQNRDNQMAYDYFMASLLLTGNTQSFVVNLPQMPAEGQDPFPKGYSEYIQHMASTATSADAVTGASTNK